jgi:hypothetical protein
MNGDYTDFNFDIAVFLQGHKWACENGHEGLVCPMMGGGKK